MRLSLRTRIKICGITDPDVARRAARVGADAIGLVFHEPSSRHLSLEQAAAISAALPPMVVSVAVMVNPEPEYVRRIIDQVHPTLLQFHGDESDGFCHQFGIPYLKAIRVSRETDLGSCERRYPCCQGVLLDTFVPDQYGGSGRPFDWSKACYDGTKPVILAGGLDMDNVCMAVEKVRPYGVDVSTSLETDGQKDPVKMADFCRQVHRADSGHHGS